MGGRSRRRTRDLVSIRTRRYVATNPQGRADMVTVRYKLGRGILSELYVDGRRQENFTIGKYRIVLRDGLTAIAFGSADVR